MLTNTFLVVADLNIHAFFQATTPTVPSAMFRLKDLWLWFDEPYGHEVPLILKNLYYSIHTQHVTDANLPAFYVPHLSAIQLFPPKDGSGVSAAAARADASAAHADAAGAGNHNGKANAKILTPSFSSPSLSTAVAAPASAAAIVQRGASISSTGGGLSLGVGLVASCSSCSLSASPMLNANKETSKGTVDCVQDAKLSAKEESELDAWGHPKQQTHQVPAPLPALAAWGAASASSLTNSSVAGGAAVAGGPGVKAGVGSGRNSWLQAVHGGGAGLGAASRVGDTPGISSEGLGGAWKSGKPSISGTNTGAIAGVVGGAWGKPRTWAAAVSTPTVGGEGAGGGVGAEAGSGKGRGGGASGVWDGEKQAKFEKTILKCSEFLAKVSQVCLDNPFLSPMRIQ